MRAARVLSVAIVLLMVRGPSGEAQETPAGKQPSRPQVTLVLSGGGARGAAHVGVLKVLEELRVPVDMIVGTSMGSIVGGLYATGWSPNDMELFLTAVDLTGYFSDRLDRRDRSFRRKQDDVPFLIQSRLRFRGFRPYLPPGVLGGQRLELLLRSIEMYSTGETDFDRMAVPYRAVACDLNTGEAVVIDHGSLATAMRASMSIPGAFPPVELDGRLLIDGGSAANFPVGIAQELGAERIIGVDISSPLTGDEVWNAFGVYLQLSSFLTVANREVDVRRMGPDDILIVPDLEDISFIDFNRVAEAIALGERAARAHEDELRRFSVSEEEYASFQARHDRPSEAERVVDEVVLVNTSPVADGVVRRRIEAPLGQTLDHEQLQRGLMSLYSLEYFGLIEDRFEREGDRGRLVIETPAPRHGRASLQFGLSLYNDFSGASQHAITVRHRVLAVNRRGGEWVNVVQTGDTAVFSTELYQPFDFGMRWFVEPTVELRRTDLPLWFEGKQISEYRWDRELARVDLGHVLGNWGELRAGVVMSNNRGENRIGLPFFPTVERKLNGARLSFRVDTLDSPIFPTSGLRVNATYGEGLDLLNTDEEYRRAFLSVDGSMTMGKFTVSPGFEVGENLNDGPSVFGLYPLGGFLRLSGLGDRELLGERSVLGRVLVYRHLFRVVFASFKAAAYVGLSLEAGNVYSEGDPLTWDSLRSGGSVFVSLDTSAGPLYLAWGYTEGGRDRLLLRFGQSF